MRSVRSSPIKPVLIAALMALSVATIGGTLTDTGPWYRALVKPSWTPPDLAFGVIWTVIFALCAISGVTAWRATEHRPTREWIVGLFAFNGFLNVFWSLLFFRFERPDLALLEVVPFWLSIGVLMAIIWPTSKIASVLLAPYLVWVSVASFLNFQIVHSNAPFGGVH
jgi:tryptophan-rich sensory protein